MKKTTPFKSPVEFEKELTSFSNKFKVSIRAHSKRISDYFEMSCYRMIVRYYEALGYSMSVCNLVGGAFRFKCSPMGHIHNFSYFKASKKVLNGQCEEFYIFHNATVQSAFDDDVFTTPDIVVSRVAKPDFTDDYYLTSKLKLSYIGRENLITFCEAKHYNPFPELMINFIGTVNELKPKCLVNGEDVPQSNVHIAPALMMSGTFSKQAERIRNSFERRYFVNFFDNLFDDVAISKLIAAPTVHNHATLKNRSNRTSF